MACRMKFIGPSTKHPRGAFFKLPLGPGIPAMIAGWRHDRVFHQLGIHCLQTSDDVMRYSAIIHLCLPCKGDTECKVRGVIEGGIRQDRGKGQGEGMKMTGFVHHEDRVHTRTTSTHASSHACATYVLLESPRQEIVSAEVQLSSSFAEIITRCIMPRS